MRPPDRIESGKNQGRGDKRVSKRTKSGKCCPSLLIKQRKWRDLQNITKILAMVLLITNILFYPLLFSEDIKSLSMKTLAKGMLREEVFELYKIENERTYRTAEEEEWLSFNHTDGSGDNGIISIHLENERVIDWTINDRDEIVEEYLSEFCSGAFKNYHPKTYQAIKSVLLKLPKEDFMDITRRSYPVIFIEAHYTGQGRFANSSDLWQQEGDPPTFTEGIWITKLSTEMEKIGSVAAIEGVVAHELAHKKLDNGKKKFTNELQMLANTLVVAWGFEKEFKEAQEIFGEGK